MQTSLDQDKILKYLALQLSTTFPDGNNLNDLAQVVPKALNKLSHCFTNSIYTQNYRDGQCYFDHLNADQYVIFVYYCSTISFFDFSNSVLATKLFYLNKVLHSFHCMFDTILPEIFLILHGAGIVLGKASYADNLVVMHGCTVGANKNFETPTLGKYLLMYPNSSIIGKCNIGDNVCIANGAFLKDEIIASNSVVFGSSPNLIIKPNKKERLSAVYDIGSLI